MRKFASIYKAAEKRKGGAQQLKSLLPLPLSVKQLKKITDDRYLAQMTRCVFNAGFHWRVVTQKWPDFEQAFDHFELASLLTKSPDEWEAYTQDTRIIRNWQKIQTVYQNAIMVDEVASEHGTFAEFFADWPVDDQIGLMKFLKKEGARLGGQTAQYFIRFIGKDGFVLSSDVVTALIANGIDINQTVTSQRDLRKVQDAFNHWQQETGMPMAHISRVLSYTVGDNIDPERLQSYQGSQRILDRQT